jgi:rod shape determining protein RodA
MSLGIIRALPAQRGDFIPIGMRRSRRRSWLRRVDWVLLVAVLALSLLGALLVWSATRQRQADVGADPQLYLKRHLVNLVIGIALAIVVALIDYRYLRAYAPIVYVASLVGLAAVLFVGTTINGAKAWIVLGFGFQLQPSEFTKLALVVLIAMVLGEKRDDRLVGVVTSPSHGDVLLVLAVAALPGALILVEPDFGMAVDIAFIVLGVLALSGAPLRWVAGLVAAGVLVAVVVLQFGLLKPYQVDRLTSFAKSDSNVSTTGYNVDQAKTAIASGGVLGKGLFNGPLTHGEFVPEQQTDFVFTVAGEELGFVGSAAIIGLFGVVLWRGMSIAARSHDSFGRLVAVGVVCWFAFQCFVNIGMTLGIMPVTGLPLPFVSYGGSAMFANLIAVGLLQNVYARSRDDDPYPA